MDRHTLAQAVAMLVVLSLLVRWLPPEAARGRETTAIESLDGLGRGEPWQRLAMDRASLREGLGSDHVLAKMLGVIRRGLDERFEQMLGVVREIQAQAAPDDVVQLRRFTRNELWMFTYFLYPLRVIGLPREEGDLPPQPQADWIMRAGDLIVQGRRESGERATLERRP